MGHWQDLRAYVDDTSGAVDTGRGYFALPGPDGATQRAQAQARTLPREDEAQTQPGTQTPPREQGRERTHGKGGKPGKGGRHVSPREVVSLVKSAPTPAPLAAVGGAADKLASLPTPGGLFPLLAALFFFIFAIVPVGPQGATRLELIWRALTGSATVMLTRGGRRQQAMTQTVMNEAGAAAVESEGNTAGVAAGIVGGIVANDFGLGNWWNN